MISHWTFRISFSKQVNASASTVSPPLLFLNCGAREVSESPLDNKEIKPVNPKGNQLWIFTGRTSAEAEAPILRTPDVKNWLIEKDPDAGWERLKAGGEGDESGEMIGWHH